MAIKAYQKADGMRALFSWPDGTGKTLAAEGPDARLARDLHRGSLDTLVNKQIGEAEKNLRRVFDRAEGADVVLLFDEADAFFGKHTAAQDAHDRYADLKANYLLQRIVDFKGMVVLVTNFRDSIDSAFNASCA